MSTNPRVCCICLTADRQAQTDRAVKSFMAQTYRDKRLLIYDTGTTPYKRTYGGWSVLGERGSIGALRNAANALTPKEDEIIAHWDSDDVSAPTRLAEQVQFLQESGADAVGYSDMLFWKSCRFAEGGTWLPRCPEDKCGVEYGEFLEGAQHKGEAWLHNNHKPNYALGTSLMYWRKTWERKPFPDTNKGCDDSAHIKDSWVLGLKVRSVSSLRMPDYECETCWREYQTNACQHGDDSAIEPHAQPMMVAEIHGGNTCASITEPSTDWTRVPAWDSKLREIMAL